MSRILLHGLTRRFKVAQVQRLFVSDYFIKQNSIINKQLFRLASTKEDKVGEKSELKKAEAVVESKCKKIDPKLEPANKNGDQKIVAHIEKKDPDHTRIWYIERVVSATLALLVPAAFASPCPALDVGLAVAFVMHNYWALESVCADYINPSTFGETIPKIVYALVAILSAVTLAGLFCFILDDVGIAQSFLCLWTVGQDIPDEVEEVPVDAKQLAEKCVK